MKEVVHVCIYVPVVFDFHVELVLYVYVYKKVVWFTCTNFSFSPH